jgi:hypothetical protein
MFIWKNRMYESSGEHDEIFIRGNCGEFILHWKYCKLHEFITDAF